ncbi:hypothetical protein BDDG_12550, partial [Blastomyces dermatitidis ATCC 18188]
SSYIDRFMFTDDSELNVESLIENLKNVIIKKLSVSCITESSVFLSTSSVSFSATFSQSSIPASVSDSPASAISVSVTLTSVTSGFTVSAFIISSSCFKKMLYRLNESYLSRITSLFNSIKIVIASVSEIILIKDDNTVKTILSHSQASSVTFSSFSVRKIVCIPDYKCSALSDSHCYSFSSASSSSSVSFISVFSALTSDSAGPVLFFNFSI